MVNRSTPHQVLSTITQPSKAASSLCMFATTAEAESRREAEDRSPDNLKCFSVGNLMFRYVPGFSRCAFLRSCKNSALSIPRSSGAIFSLRFSEVLLRWQFDLLAKTRTIRQLVGDFGRPKSVQKFPSSVPTQCPLPAFSA